MGGTLMARLKARTRPGHDGLAMPPALLHLHVLDYDPDGLVSAKAAWDARHAWHRDRHAWAVSHGLLVRESPVSWPELEAAREQGRVFWPPEPTGPYRQHEPASAACWCATGPAGDNSERENQE